VLIESVWRFANSSKVFGQSSPSRTHPPSIPSFSPLPQPPHLILPQPFSTPLHQNHALRSTNHRPPRLRQIHLRRRHAPIPLRARPQMLRREPRPRQRPHQLPVRARHSRPGEAGGCDGGGGVRAEWGGVVCAGGGGAGGGVVGGGVEGVGRWVGLISFFL